MGKISLSDKILIEILRVMTMTLSNIVHFLL